jgi:hypothetical protein
VKFPIVTQGEWMTLTWQEAETREQALLIAATDWVNSCNKQGDIKVRLDPSGISGSGSPSIELIVQQAHMIFNPKLGGRKWSPDLGIPLMVQDGWETESIWAVPEHFD